MKVIIWLAESSVVFFCLEWKKRVLHNRKEQDQLKVLGFANQVEIHFDNEVVWESHLQLLLTEGFSYTYFWLSDRSTGITMPYRAEGKDKNSFWSEVERVYYHQPWENENNKITGINIVIYQKKTGLIWCRSHHWQQAQRSLQGVQVVLDYDFLRTWNLKKIFWSVGCCSIKDIHQTWWILNCKQEAYWCSRIRILYCDLKLVTSFALIRCVLNHVLSRIFSSSFTTYQTEGHGYDAETCTWKAEFHLWWLLYSESDWMLQSSTKKW